MTRQDRFIRTAYKISATYAASRGNVSTLGELIRNRRELLGLTQQQLADTVGVSQPAVNQWENDAARVSWDNIGPLARALGVSAASLAALMVDDGEGGSPGQKGAGGRLPRSREG